MSATRTRIRTGVILVALGTMLAAVAVVAPVARAAAPTTCEPHPVLCPEHLYLGVAIEGLPEDPDADAPFAEATGVSPSVGLSFMSFLDQFETVALRRLSDSGQMPMVTWEPWNWSGDRNTFPLKAIAAGTFDSYLREQGAALAAVGAPVVVRFGHEMNGNWYPWGNGVYGNTPADFIAAYRHVHDVVSDAGATNVVWLWSPNTLDATKGVQLTPFYPGDDYVDWVGLSSYFSLPYNNWVGVAKQTLFELDQLAPTKPIYIAETSVLAGPNRPAMIRELMTGIRAIPRMVGMNWFNYSEKNDYRIQNDPPAARELAVQLASPHFGHAGQMDDPVVASPMSQKPPTLTGTAHVGQTLSGSAGTWRSTASSGALSASSRWYRCSDAVNTATCVAATAETSQTATQHALTPADFGSYLRLGSTSTNAVGTTVAWSASSLLVIMTPQAPAPPTVEARDGALRVIFPAGVPVGTTHWRLTLNGVAKPLIPVGRYDYWLTGLVNGTNYNVSLAAASSSASTRTNLSAATSGVAVPLPAPWTPASRSAERPRSSTCRPNSCPRTPGGW